ncbi:MAG: hypothetical protein J7K26_03995 [Candidatus Aenigmarchaeota archaeon]|nr:hypothetical protein [Candidatus Aenigmarchaeota archaeon]
MNKKYTIVMPEPKLEIKDGKFWFTGKAIEVHPTDDYKALDHLKEAGVYNSDKDVYNGFVNFYPSFSKSRKRLEEEVDQVLTFIDGNRLKKDLEENDYAFLMHNGDVPKDFRDGRDKNFIAGTDRIIQELVYQKIPDEFGLDFPVRHLKTQEAVELIYSDDRYRAIMNDYHQFDSEVLQKLVEQSKIGLKLTDNDLNTVQVEPAILIPTKIAFIMLAWDKDKICPNIYASKPVGRLVCSIAALKREEPRKIA